MLLVMLRVLLVAFPVQEVLFFLVKACGHAYCQIIRKGHGACVVFGRIGEKQEGFFFA